MDETDDVVTQPPTPKKRGKPRKIEVDPPLSDVEYRRLYQREYYRLHPRKIVRPKLTEEEIRKRDLEYARNYYVRNKEKMIAQIIESQKRKREEKKKLV